MLLKSSNKSLVKEALQYIFWEYEKGRELSKKSRKDIIPLVEALSNHENIKVRRWFYIVISIIRPENVELKIKILLKGKEKDNENLSWACASLFSCIGEESAWDFFKRYDTPLTSAQIELSSLLFSKSTTKILSSSISLEKLLLNDDPLIPQWIILLYGYTYTSSVNRNSYEIDKTIIRSLTQHPDRMVVEYAVWSLTYKDNTSYKDLGRPVEELIKHPSNVRRWLYQLLGKNEESLSIFVSFLFEQIEKENAIDALDGLAKAITNRYLGKEFSEKIIKWYLHTDDFTIRIRLLKCFAIFHDYEDDYIQILKEEAEEDPLLMQGIFGSALGAENIFLDRTIFQHDTIKVVKNYFFINKGVEK
ncbi:MAG: hypothetical protein D3903_16000 [Candidatus Electrothrix sp. GM3_4]|nr:hypothetical protein [Candidatus Electrothrix sp. GM3_4]